MTENFVVKRPALWEKSLIPFWDDEHISKGMLASHLNPDTDAASRKPETIEATVEWLSKLITEEGKILDLGCGPGLYTKKLAERGYKVTGMDFSRRSIAYAKEHDAKSEYIYRDYMTLDYEGEFDAVTLIYCDYGALTRPDRIELLSRIYKALKPGGIFVFDVFTENFSQENKRERQESYSEKSGFWSAVPYTCHEATFLYDGGRILADRNIVEAGDKTSDYIIWDSYYTRESLVNEIEENAYFKITDIRGDSCGAEYTAESDTLCAVALKE